MDEAPFEYYGDVLTSVCGQNTDKSVIKRLQCTRLLPARWQNRPSSSNISAVACHNHGDSRNTFTPIKLSQNVWRISGTDKDGNDHVTCDSQCQAARWSSNIKRKPAITKQNILVRTPSNRTTFSSLSFQYSQTLKVSDRLSSKSSNQQSTSPSRKLCKEIIKNLNLTFTGLSVWCLEQKKLSDISSTEHGFFHQGNVYIVLERKNDGDTLLHIWYGSLSSQDDQVLASCIVNELDQAVSGASFLSLEWEGFETGIFHSHFPEGIIHVEGKSFATSPSSLKYRDRLYHFKGRRFATATCMTCSASAVTDDNIIILDGYPKMYVCIGENVDHALRLKALYLVQMMNAKQRMPKGQIIVMDENDEELKEIFYKKLNPHLPCDKLTSVNSCDDILPQETLKLFRLNGDRPEYDMPLVSKYPLQQKYLTSKDIFLLQVKSTQPVYIWVGSCADLTEINESCKYGLSFMQFYNFPSTTALCRIRENKEPLQFKRCFKDWKNHISTKTSQATHAYNIANIERMLLSKFQLNIVGKLREFNDEFDDIGNHQKYQVWIISENMEPLITDRYLAFDRNHSYLIMSQEANDDNKVLYYWLGDKVTEEKRNYALNVVLHIKQNGLVIRVLEGKEPNHFLNKLNHLFIVYDADSVQDLKVSDIHFNLDDGKVMMFNVRENQNNVTVYQVQAQSSCLCSSSAFVIISNSKNFLWFGRNSSALEREYSKKLLSFFFPERSHEYNIITEGKETNIFWQYVTPSGKYLELSNKKNTSQSHPRLIVCYLKEEKCFFEDIENFTSEFLQESYIYILDTRSRIIIWLGQAFDERVNGSISKLIDAYVSRDLAQRQNSDIEICILLQSTKPPFFGNYFKEINFRSQEFYQKERNKLKMENALFSENSLTNTNEVNSVYIPYTNGIKNHDLKVTMQTMHSWSNLQTMNSIKLSK